MLNDHNIWWVVDSISHPRSTKYFDDELQTYYYGYRYYSPELGRWLSRDPIEEKGGHNLYGFVRNRPVIHVDPRGKRDWIIIPNPLNPILPIPVPLPGSGNPAEREWGRQRRNLCCATAIRFPRIDTVVRDAMSGAGYDSGGDLDNLDNTVVNAVLHCSMTCTIASKWRCTVRQSRDFMEAHERGTPNNPVEWRNLDIFNNNVGASLARNGMSADDCIDACEDAARRYQFRWFLDLAAFPPPTPRNPARLPTAPNSRESDWR